MDRRDPGEILGGLIPQARFLTLLILIVNSALFVAMWVYGQRTGLPEHIVLVQFGAKVPWQLHGAEWWRFITAGFLHGGILHILMNSWVLFDLGAEVEAAYGTSRTIVVYILSTITGFWASALFARTLSVGSSAGIFGLIGAMIAFGVMERGAMGAAVKSLYIRWAVYGLVLGLLPGIDNAAHIGGLAGGFVTAFIASTPRARLQWKEPIIKVAAALCILLTLAAFALMLRGLISGRVLIPQ